MLLSLPSSLVLLLLSLEAAAVPRQHGKKTFHIQQKRSGQVFKSGPLAMMRVVQKYGSEVPKRLRVAAIAAAAQQGTVEANPLAYDSSYLSPVQIGNQTLQLDFDTGSSDLWVFSTELTTPLGQGQDAYNPASSGAKEMQGATWKIGYADGSGASGNVFVDKVVIGGVTATSQAVEAATSVSTSFQQTAQEDGMLGLGFSKLNTVQPTQQTTFFDTVKDTLAEKLFAVALRKATPGAYDFGYIDQAKYTGDMHYIPVNSTQGYWAFDAGDSIGYSIMDTGTSLFVVPPAVCQKYYAQVPSAAFNQQQNGYTFPCNSALPDYNVTIGGVVFSLPGSFLNYAPIDSAGQNCFGGMQPNTNVPFSIFGDVFMKAFYVVFDARKDNAPQLGIAVQAGRDQTATNTAQSTDSEGAVGASVGQGFNATTTRRGLNDTTSGVNGTTGGVQNGTFIGTRALRKRMLRMH